MLKQTVQYKDFDDNESNDTLYFNITKSELSENLDLTQRFQALKDMFEGEEQRLLSMPEIQQILDLVKEVMRLAYGIKSPDGKSFRKSDELWTEFTQTAAYDAFLFSLFENPQKANDFLIGVFPQDLMAAAETQIKAGVAPQVIENAEIRVAPDAIAVTPGAGDIVVAPEPEDTRPAWLRENRKPTDHELREMPREEMVLAMQWVQKNQ